MMQFQIPFSDNITDTATAIQRKPLPGMVSKGELCAHFRISAKTLRTTILTDTVLLAAGCCWKPNADNPSMTAVQYKHLLPPNLTQMVYLMHSITELHNQIGE